MNGKLIVIEGVDGAGKTTQCKLLKEYMECRGIPVVLTRECSDGPIGKLLRKLYLPGTRKCDERVINMLYAADRLDHITNAEDGMLHTLENGSSVINDRYYLSSCAYDTYTYVNDDAFDAALQNILERNRINMELLRPDLTIFLDLDPEVAFTRLGVRTHGNFTVYEHLEKLQKIHKAYHRAIEILRGEGERIEILDANRDQEAIAAQIQKLIHEIYSIEEV